MSSYQILNAAPSVSFPSAHAFLDGSAEDGEALVILGENAGATFRSLRDLENRPFVAIELGIECLGVHTGESRGREGSNIVGFARYRLGT
ncbi:MAG: 3-hydroxyacyl-CoA dehydrogenase, partial [Gemmatimonadales bacterium]|nr:3-hydroxyacyl-CoA dehydrogenase [Gemmatimonadales bacterium]